MKWIRKIKIAFELFVAFKPELAELRSLVEWFCMKGSTENWWHRKDFENAFEARFTAFWRRLKPKLVKFIEGHIEYPKDGN